jgi:hypothetical protein
LSPAPDPLLQLTRVLLVVGILLTAGTGIGLWLLPGNTADFWAWTIGAAPSASFLGAGYVGAAVSLALALREKRWRRARASVVSALAFTTLALAVTARHSEPFEWGADAAALPRASAWTWLAVYVLLPPVALVALVLQDRRATPLPRAAPLGRVTTAALLLGGAGLGAVGLLLLAEWGRMLSAWPWPLTPLTADMIGAWVVTAAVTLLWIALRERDAARARPASVGGAVFAILALAAALRSHHDLDGGRATAVYVLGLLAACAGLATFAVKAHRTEAARAPYRQTS